jgi:hypothetical protein
MSKQLKYKILDLKKDHALTFIKLATICQVTERQIINWCNIPTDHYSSIPSDKLRLLSEYFNISMEEMYTESDLITA